MTQAEHHALRGDGVISVNSVTKVYDVPRGEDVTALKSIGLTVSGGEFIALVGPSGCGKSTLLRLMSGLEEPTTGTVSMGSQSPQQAIASHRLGIAFQDHALLPWLDVTRNIALPMRLAGVRVDPDRISDLIHLVGLGGFESLRPAQLSGGMCQRVSIARALAMSPPFLLLDEPFGALDLVTRRRLNFELERIWLASAPTCVLVTHSVQEAVLLADRIVVLSPRPGQIVGDHRVDLPRPRDASLMQCETYVRLVGDVTADLDRVTPAGTSNETVRPDHQNEGITQQA